MATRSSHPAPIRRRIAALIAVIITALLATFATERHQHRRRAYGGRASHQHPETDHRACPRCVRRLQRLEHRRRPADVRRVPSPRLLEPTARTASRRRIPAPVPVHDHGPVVLVGHSYGGAVITNAPPATPTSSPWSTSPRTPSTKAKASQQPTGSAVGTPTSPTTRAPALPGLDRRQRRRLHRPGPLPPTLRPGPAALDHPGDGRHPATRSPGRAGDPLRPASVEVDPELVPRREPRPHHPARSRTSDGQARADAKTVRSTAHTSR